MMVRKKFQLLTPVEKLELFFQKNRKKFSGVTQVASSVDWNIYYAFFKPEKPSEAEIKAFYSEVKKLKEELVTLKRHFKPVNPYLLRVVENKLEHIVEEFVEYPFSNRRNFFQLRLNLLRDSLQRCFIG